VPCVSGRSRDRRHRHDWTGTHAGWRSAHREIAPAQLADRRPPVVPMFCVPADLAGAAVGNATLVQENDSAGQTAPELAVLCRSAAANSPSTGSALSAFCAPCPSVTSRRGDSPGRWPASCRVTATAPAKSHAHDPVAGARKGTPMTVRAIGGSSARCSWPASRVTPGDARQ